MIEPIAYSIVALFAMGMAGSFLAADPHAPTSRALSLFFVFLGIALLMNIPASASLYFESPFVWTRLFSLMEIGIVVSAAEWILRIGRTEASPGPTARSGERLIRAGQALAILYGLAGIALPEARRELWNVRPRLELLVEPGYYVFAVPFNLAAVLMGVRLLQIVRANLDRAERIRLAAFGLAAPFWIAGMFLAWRWIPLSFAIGELVFLVGAIRYHVLQGQRGQFLARFLSPQLTRLVGDRGLASAMQQNRVELSVVACDLRGFTAFAAAAPPADVMRLLDELYAAAGEVVSSFGGSIKDFAGDGILALVGAPLPCPDHPQRAAAMALALRDRVESVLAPWRRSGREIGVGVGVASGVATVGALGGRERLEYAAVGPVVNLAARLCSHARAGQILADEGLVAALGTEPAGLEIEGLEPVELKGFAHPIPIHALRAGHAGIPTSREAGAG